MTAPVTTPRTAPAAQSAQSAPSARGLPTVGSTRARDRAAAAAVQTHHAEMARTLGNQVWSLTGATRSGRLESAEAHRRELVAWCRGELLPHALAEESTMYDAAWSMPASRLLVVAMLAEHRVLGELVDQLDRTTEPVAATALARALQAVFEVHLAKENDQVLPLLLTAPSVSVADLLGGMHELLGSTGARDHQGTRPGTGRGARPGTQERPES